MSSYYETIGAYVRLSGAWVRHEAPRKFRSPTFLGFAYALVGLVTFGHVAAEASKPNALVLKQVEICQTAEQRIAVGSFCYRNFDNDFPPPAMRGIAAGVLWPLYLSWELQQ